MALITSDMKRTGLRTVALGAIAGGNVSPIDIYTR